MDKSVQTDGGVQPRSRVYMHSSINLNRIDIIVYWKATFGNIHQFELHPGCSANAKRLFQKKR